MARFSRIDTTWPDSGGHIIPALGRQRPAWCRVPGQPGLYKKKSQKPPPTKKQNKEVVLELKLFNKLRETVLDKAGWPGTLSFLF